MRSAAIVVAAGSGARAGGGFPKQYRPLRGKPVLRWSVEAMLRAGLEEVVVAIGEGHQTHFASAIAGLDRVRGVLGGATRTASVQAALAEIPDADIVLIHDAARPGLTEEVVHALIDAVDQGTPAAAPALPLADTLLRVDDENRVVGPLSRAGVVQVQTPQAFHGATLRAAYASVGEGATFTDDLSVAMTAGAKVHLVPGFPRLMKLTYEADFAHLEALMSQDRFNSVGHGIDAHRFGDGSEVTLCGVKIAHDRGLSGHSDADVGWHALVDAILGALSAGDIGEHFPPSDPRWRGANSEIFLRHAVRLAAEAGAEILQADITLICERPKVGPHREAMRKRTSEVLGIPMDRVSVKATTTERLGFLGREEGLAAHATAVVDRCK